MLSKIKILPKKEPIMRTDRLDKVLIGLIYLIRTIIFFAGIRLLFYLDWFHFSIAVTAFILTFLPYFVQRTFHLLLPIEINFVNSFFVFTTLFLGSIGKYYFTIWWWDLVLHFLSGIILGLVVFIVLYVLYCERKIIIQPILIPVVAFSFALSFGALWEIYEFAVDQTFGIAMQDNSLIDTMSDLVADCIGAIISAVFGFLYLKNSGGHVSKFIRKLIWNTKKMKYS